MKRHGLIKAAALLFLAGTILLMAGCNEEVSLPRGMQIPEPEAEVLNSFDENLIAASNELGLKIFQGLFTPEENLMISPTSIYTALAMTYNGARGETREAMGELFGAADMDLQQFNKHNLARLYMLQTADPEVIINIANSLWMRAGEEFDQDFLERNQKYYLASSRVLDFGSSDSAEIINGWVKESTEGLIEEIVEYPFNPLTILFLINAVYFQGDWSEPFDPEITAKGIFYSPSGEMEDIPFMQRSDEMFYLEKEGEFQAVRLPYGEDERLAMYVFLPAESSSPETFAAGLELENWQEWRQQFTGRPGWLQLPSFKMEYEKTLNETLKKLGMEIAFDQERADFFDMIPRNKGPNLFISEVKHKAFIEVDEKGTEAAAVTSVEIQVTSAPPQESFHMEVNRPFYFLIHDRGTDELLFAGFVAEPDLIQNK